MIWFGKYIKFEKQQMKIKYEKTLAVVCGGENGVPKENNRLKSLATFSHAPDKIRTRAVVRDS